MNRRRLLFVSFTLVVVGASFAWARPEPVAPSRGQVVIANRSGGTISVIDTHSDEVIGTFALPTGENTPEPMYIVPSRGRVFVGDRANDRVAVFDAATYAGLGTVPAGAGVFHMAIDRHDRQIWVNNDISNTATVIDPVSLQVLATVPMPADLVAMGARPHDVILDPRDGRHAYVTMIGVPGPNDVVVKFSTESFSEVARNAVGKDPHLSASHHDDSLYLPCQNSNVVVVLRRDDLQLVAEIPVPGAHGAGMTRHGKVFYTTNLPGGGPNGLFAIDTDTNTVIGAGVDTPFATPHNLALTPNSRKLYMTHSGPSSDKVTIYQVNGNDAVPAFVQSVTVGLNPFGIAYIP